MDGLDFQEIKKSELENEFTIGAEYYGKKYVESISVVKRQKKTIPLGQMWILATDGDHGSPDYQESGVLYLLSECVKEGYIEKAKCRYITEAKNRELKRSCLHPGDIVVTKTGVYFGKSAVIPESIPEANTIAHVGKITLKSQYNPYYVSTFLNCKYGYCQLRRRGIKATRPEIKLVEFPDIVLVSTVRPNRGAVAILGNGDLLVSGAFTVLREDGDYPKEVLQVLLRTSMYRDWLLRFNVGTSYPVIKDEDVLNMPIPILGDDIKQDVVAKVNESASLRRQSKQLLEYAKQAVEMAIEQGEDIALAWLKSKVEQ